MGLGTRTAIVAVGVLVTTLLLGWWAAAAVGAVWGAVALPKTRPALTAALGGLVAWAALLAWSAVRGPVPELAGMVGSIMGIGGWGLVGMTLLYPAMLAGASAVLTGAVRAKLLPGARP